MVDDSNWRSNRDEVRQRGVDTRPQQKGTPPINAAVVRWEELLTLIRSIDHSLKRIAKAEEEGLKLATQPVISVLDGIAEGITERTSHVDILMDPNYFKYEPKYGNRSTRNDSP